MLHAIYYIFRGRRGMTLIELLVVIGIMATLTGVLVGFSRQSRDQILLNTEKAKIAQTIARTKSLTLAGYTKPVTLPPPCAYGFGIDYPKSEYFIFEYSPVNCQGISNLTSLDTNSNPPFKIFENFKLPTGVNFAQSNDSLAYLIFIPPNLNSLLFKSPSEISSAPLEIHLETPDESLQRGIIVNPNGQLTF